MGAIKMRRVDQAEAQGQSMNYHVKKTADGEPRQPGDRSQLNQRRDATIRVSSSEFE